MRIAVVIDGQRFVFNIELDVDAHTPLTVRVFRTIVF